MNLPQIPLEACRHGYLYKIWSRNLTFGVYNEKSKGFIGIREKFGYEYLFTEYHWDVGSPLGTVNPKEELELCRVELDEDSQELFDWLREREQQYNGKI